MVGAVGKQGKKGKLGTAVALPKRMDSVQLGEEVRGDLREVARSQLAQELVLSQPSEQAAHLLGDVLRVAERAGALRNPHCSEFSGPIVDVLEQVMVDGAVVGDRKATIRQRLLRAREGHGG